MQIHPQAIISPRATIGRGVYIGPLCVIEDDVVIGNGCYLEARVSLKKGVQLGANNHLFEGTTIGGIPQCVGLHDICGQVIIGSGNTIRENVTIHRAMKEGDSTEVGDDCMFMVNSHIAHDCRIGNQVIMANNTMLAGHVSVGRRAFLSGAVGVHQHCRIGAFAMVGGQAHVVRDVPPFVTVDGLTSQVVGLNNIGLRRAGFTTEDIKVLKALYRVLYRSNLSWRETLKRIQADFTTGPCSEMADFLSSTTRGITMERRSVGRVDRIHLDEVPEAFRFQLIDEDGEARTPAMPRKGVG